MAAIDRKQWPAGRRPRLASGHTTLERVPGRGARWVGDRADKGGGQAEPGTAATGPGTGRPVDAPRPAARRQERQASSAACRPALCSLPPPRGIIPDTDPSVEPAIE
jgi:hypothetical protein